MIFKRNHEKITIETFGSTMTLTGRIVGGFQHGFNSTSGSWCLSDLGGTEFKYTKAYFILFVEKGRRKPITINDKRVISCKVIR